MKNAWKFLEYFFVITAFPLLYWAGYVMASDMIFFSQHGVEQQVVVKSREENTFSRRGITSYHYRLDMDGKTFRRSFSKRFSVGEIVVVLVAPDNSENLILGSKSNNMFELFSLYVGGKIIAVFIIVFYLIIISLTALGIRTLIRNRGRLYEV